MQYYSDADQRIHQLCQTIAKANRTYVSPKDDDSHTNLFFDGLGPRITGRWIVAGAERYLMVLNLENQQFEWLNGLLELVEAFHTIGKTQEEVEGEIEGKLPTMGLDPSGFREKLHFEIPTYDFADDKIQQLDPKGLQEWIRLRTIANLACFNLLGYLQLQSEIRIWPHHFDTGIYVETSSESGIGFGLAMQDDVAGAPYFYMAGYSSLGEVDFMELPDLGIGQWETEKAWKGAILPVKTLENEAAFQEELHLFLCRAVNWFVCNLRQGSNT